jgi:ferritin-like protein
VIPIEWDIDANRPADVSKLIELRAMEARGLAENDYFTVNDARIEIARAEVRYHARLDAERAAEWGKMPPHP